MNSETEKYLILKGVAGFGNRIRAFLQAVVYAKLTDRKLIVDWRDGMYAPKGVNSFFEFFESPGLSKDDIIPKFDSVYPKIWKNRAEEYPYELFRVSGRIPTGSDFGSRVKEKFSIDINNLDYQEQGLFVFDYAFTFNHNEYYYKLPTEWQVKNRESLLKILIRNHLHLKKEIKNEISAFKNKYFKNSVIGVHVRYTDNLENPAGEVIIGDYYQRIDNILKEKPEAIIFLCSDNISVLKEFKKRYKNVIATEKEYPKTPGEAMHVAMMAGKTSVAKQALIDMYLLAECDYLVYSRMSSFSKISALLADDKKIKLFNVDEQKDIFNNIFKKTETSLKFNLAKYPNNIFIETGTYKGDGVQAALNAGFKKIYSIEVFKDFYDISCKRFEKEIAEGKVKLFLGDSIFYFKNMLKDIKEPATIWLDAYVQDGHRGIKDCSIYEDLDTIAMTGIKNNTIIINGKRLFKRWGVDEKVVRQKLLAINPKYDIFYEKGFIDNDVIVAMKKKYFKLSGEASKKVVIYSIGFILDLFLFVLGFFGQISFIYFFIFFIFTILSALVLELYLRIQHNIDRIFNFVKNDSESIKKVIKDNKDTINKVLNKIDSQKEELDSSKKIINEIKLDTVMTVDNLIDIKAKIFGNQNELADIKKELPDIKKALMDIRKEFPDIKNELAIFDKKFEKINDIVNNQKILNEHDRVQSKRISAFYWSYVKEKRAERLLKLVPDIFEKKSVLYVGARPDRSDFINDFLENSCEITILEIFRPNAEYFKTLPWVHEVIEGDISNFIPTKKYDAVFWWHGPEHVSPEKVAKTLKNIELFTNKYIILGCPWGEVDQPKELEDENVFEKHLSAFDVGYFEGLGYKTDYFGIKNNLGSNITSVKRIKCL